MSPEQVAEARSWCDHCPVARDCFMDSIIREERFGIWGGFTPEERFRAIAVSVSYETMIRALDYGLLPMMVVRIRRVG